MSPRYCDVLVVMCSALSVVTVTPVLADQLSQHKISGVGAAGDKLGQCVETLGDWDGDGTTEVAIGAVLADSGSQADTGILWIVSLASSGDVVDTVRVGDGDLGGALHPANRFGSAVAYLGDLDGPGGQSTHALAVGASGDDGPSGHTEDQQGSVWILFFDDEANLLSYREISDWSDDFGTLVNPLEQLDGFGTSVEYLGDLDGPGGSAAAIAVGAIGDDDECPNGPGGSQRGAVWILFLEHDGTVSNRTKLGDGLGLRCEALFGESVAWLGDLDGPDFGSAGALAVGAIGNLNTDRGAIWILFLSTSGVRLGSQEISETEGGFYDVLDNQDRLGGSLECAGDLDGDGIPDLITGTENDDDGGTNHGAVRILYMNRNGTVHGYQKISELYGGFSGPLSDQDAFGVSVAQLGDLDSDGTTDLIVGALQDDESGTDSGAAWVLFLPQSGPCCFGSTCLDLWEVTCTTNGGTYVGDAQPCACGPNPIGGCCFGELCLAMSQCQCEADGGVWVGEDGCVESPCFSVASPELVIPADRRNRILGRPTPNPSGHRVEIPLLRGTSQRVRLEIVDVQGRIVARVLDGFLPESQRLVEWSATDRSGRPVAAGVYFVSLRVGDVRESERIVLVR